MSELLHEQIFFTERVYASLPMGVEIYDADGILRALNERARLMYGVERAAVVDKVNLFDRMSSAILSLRPGKVVRSCD